MTTIMTKLVLVILLAVAMAIPANAIIFQNANADENC